MSEAQLAALVVAITALPAMFVGILCLTGKLMPSAFTHAREPQRMRRVMGNGLLLVGLAIFAFSGAVATLPLPTLRWLTPVFAAGITLACLLLTVWMIRLSRR